jgi:hypothetical protein
MRYKYIHRPGYLRVLLRGFLNHYKFNKSTYLSNFILNNNLVNLFTAYLSVGI